VFDNDAGPISVFTVTGTVIVNVVCVCLTGVASGAGGNIEMGIAGATAVLLPTTLGTNLAAGEIWHDATPDAEIELASVVNEAIISDSNNIILTLSAQIDSGELAFYCFWAALSADGWVE